MTVFLRHAGLLLVATTVALAEVPHHRLSDWLRELKIPVPAGTSLPLPAIGTLELLSGECTNLTIGHVHALDNSSGLELELGIELHGLGITCELQAYNSGNLTVNVTMTDSSFALAVQMHPYFPPMTPQLPLPLGHLNMTTCNMHLQTSGVSFGGDSPVVALASNFDSATLSMLMGTFLQEPLCGEIEQIIENNGTEAMGIGAAILSQVLLPPYPLPEPTITAPIVDWGTYPPILAIQELIAERFPVWAGRKVEVLKAGIDKTIMQTETGLKVDMQEVSIDGLATHVPGLAIITNHTTVGFESNLTSLQFKAALGLSVLMPDQPGFIKDIETTFGLRELNVAARLLYNGPEMHAMMDNGEFHALSCLIDTAESATSPASDSIAITDMFVFLKAGTNIQITHPPLDFLEQNATDTVNTIIAALQAGYLNSISALIDGGLGMARQIVNEALWRNFDKQPTCEEMKEGVADSTLAALWGSAIAAAGLGVVAAAFAPILLRSRKGSKRDVGKTGNKAVEEHAEDAKSEPSTRAGTSSADAMLAEPEMALMFEPAVPKWLALFYPCALLSILFLFLYADLALGAIVNVRMDAAGDSETMGPVFEFSLINTIEHAWEAGAWLIAVLTLIMSGIWPVAKLSMLLVAWVVPARILGHSRRRRFLSFLDLAGKYSFLDSWFLVLSMSAFALQWNGQSTMLKVQTLPMSAFYAFFLATVLSLVLGHVASELHSYGAAHPELHLDAPQALARQGTSPLANFPLCSFSKPRNQWGLGLSMAFTFLMAVLASLLTSFEYQMGGLASEVLDVHSKHYSLLTVGLSVPDAASGGAGLWSLEVSFIVLAIVLPLLLVALQLLLWLVPLKRRTQDRLIHVCHMLDCWACMDVAALTLAILAMQLGYLTQFLVQSNKLAAPCALIKDITKEECFNVEIKLHPGFFFLLVAGVAMVVVPKVAIRACKAAILARDEMFEQELAKGAAVASQVSEKVRAARAAASDEDNALDNASHVGTNPEVAAEGHEGNDIEGNAVSL